MFCQSCGTEIPAASAFCPKCGKPVEEAAASVTDTAAATQTLAEVAAAPAQTLAETAAKTTETHDVPPPPPPKKKGLLGPIITLLVSASGWLYILVTNSIEGVLAWFTSSSELQNSVSGQYNTFGNHASSEEMAANIILIIIMVLFTLLAIVGVVWLIRRLVRKFIPPRKPR